MGVSGDDLYNLTINTEAAAKYLNDELEKRTITASVLADYIKAAVEPVDIERSVKDDMMRRPAPAVCSTQGEDVTRATVLRAVPFVFNWLSPQIAPVQFKQVERAMPALASARCRRINSKTASPFSSQTIQIFIHPFSSFPPLNAIKKIAHTPAARTRSTTKVCIFKHLLSVSARPYGQPIYRLTPPW